MKRLPDVETGSIETTRNDTHLGSGLVKLVEQEEQSIPKVETGSEKTSQEHPLDWARRTLDFEAEEARLGALPLGAVSTAHFFAEELIRSAGLDRAQELAEIEMGFRGAYYRPIVRP